MRSIKAECGHRTRKTHIKNGECRECRGIDKPERVDTGSNSWNASGEQLDVIEAHNRQRIIQNDR